MGLYYHYLMLLNGQEFGPIDSSGQGKDLNQSFIIFSKFPTIPWIEPLMSGGQDKISTGEYVKHDSSNDK